MNIKENKRILILLGFLVVLFLAAIVYLSYFTIFEASDIVKHSANRRETLREESIKRGTVYDREGNVLAYSDGEKGSYQRHYTYQTIYAHALGYYSKIRGKTGIEASYDSYLSGSNENQIIQSIKSVINADFDPNVGNSVYMTTNTNIQQKARDLLAEYGSEGAIVVMNPKTGEILAMVSYPDFNIQTVDADYAAIIEQNTGALVNRAIRSKFAPGSTFKIVTATAIIESGINQNYTDTGEEKIGGYPIKNANQKSYGDIGLYSAFTNSVNTYFANKAVSVGAEKLGSVAEKFMFNKTIDFDLNVEVSNFNYSDWDTQALASAGFGQGDVLSTPLEMCLVSSAIANNGTLMTPYLVSQVLSSDGTKVVEKNPTVLSEVTTAEIASQIKEMMVSTVNEGGASAARVSGVQVAGKTGTAQISSEKNNAWFVGFAPAEDPQISIAIVIQNVESYAGEVAAPIAGELIDYSLKQINY